MAFARPPFDELRNRIAGDMRSQLRAAGKRADPLLRRSKMWVLSWVYAAIFHVLYGALEWISLQILPSTATDMDYLLLHGEAQAEPRKLATKSSGIVRFTGVNTTLVPDETEFVREDGLVYVLTASGAITGGLKDIAAESDIAGADTNMDAGTVLTLASPIAGIDAEVTYVSGFDTGTDDEELEAYRDRIVSRMKSKPRAGTRDDFEAWAREVPGVFRAYCVPHARGLGTVDVYFLHEEGDLPGRIPTSGQVTEMQAYLESVCNVILTDPGDGTEPGVMAKAPTPTPVDFEIAYIDPDTGDTRDALEAEFAELFMSFALVRGSETVHPNQTYSAGAQASGVDGFDIDVPASPITAGVGQVFVVGTVSYT